MGDVENPNIVYPITSADVVMYDEDNNITIKDKVDDILQLLDDIEKR